MFQSPLLRRLSLALALVALPSLALADDPTEFIRFAPGKGQGHGALQIAKATYESPKTGVKVILYGVVHIADAEYYAQVQKDLDSYTAVLYEGVGKPPKGYKPDESMVNLSKMQKGMGELLGLQFQKDGINYKAKNLVHADMTWEQFVKASGGDASKALPGAGMMNPEMLKRLGPMLEMGLQFAKQMFDRNPAMRNNFKLNMAKQMTGQVAQMAGSDQMKVIVVDRNIVAMKVLDRELANRKGTKDSLALFYGAAHNADFHARLVKRGFKQTSKTWLNAWNVGDGPIGAERTTPKPEPKPEPTAKPGKLDPTKTYY